MLAEVAVVALFAVIVAVFDASPEILHVSQVITVEGESESYS